MSNLFHSEFRRIPPKDRRRIKRPSRRRLPSEEFDKDVKSDDFDSESEGNLDLSSGLDSNFESIGYDSDSEGIVFIATEWMKQDCWNMNPMNRAHSLSSAVCYNI